MADAVLLGEGAAWVKARVEMHAKTTDECIVNLKEVRIHYCFVRSLAVRCLAVYSITGQVEKTQPVLDPSCTSALLQPCCLSPQTRFKTVETLVFKG